MTTLSVFRDARLCAAFVFVCCVCCAYVCELFVYYFSKIVMSIMYVNINVIIVRQEIEINSD